MDNAKIHGCESLAINMSLCVDSALTADELAAFNAHLSACGACRAEWELFREIHGALHEMPQIDLPADLRSLTLARIRSLSQPVDLLTAQKPAKRGLFGKKQSPVRHLAVAGMTKEPLKALNWKGLAVSAACAMGALVAVSFGLSLISVPETSGRGMPMAYGGGVAEAPAIYSPDGEEMAIRMSEPFIPTESDENAIAPDAASGAPESENLRDSGLAAAALDEAALRKEAAADAEPAPSETSLKQLNICLEVDNFDAAKQALYSMNGYTSYAQLDYGNAYVPPSGTVARRVGTADYEAAKTYVASIGTVLWSNESETDLTYQLIDLNASLKSKEAERERLSALLRQSQNISVMVAVENRLAMLQDEIDAVKGQTIYNADQAGSPKIYVELVQKQNDAYAYNPPETFGEQVAAALFASVRGSVAFGEWFLVTLAGGLVPFAIVAGLAVVVMLVILKTAGKGTRHE